MANVGLVSRTGAFRSSHRRLFGDRGQGPKPASLLGRGVMLLGLAASETRPSSVDAFQQFIGDFSFERGPEFLASGPFPPSLPV